MPSLYLSDAQRDAVKAVVSQAQELECNINFCTTGVGGFQERDPDRTTMLAIASLTSAFFDTRALTSLTLNLLEYPPDSHSPILSLKDLLPLERLWPRLRNLKFHGVTFHIDELRALVAAQCGTLESFDCCALFPLSGLRPEVVDCLRGLDRLKKCEIGWPSNRDPRLNGRMNDRMGAYVSTENLNQYILRKIETSPLEG